MVAGEASSSSRGGTFMETHPSHSVQGPDGQTEGRCQEGRSSQGQEGGKVDPPLTSTVRIGGGFRATSFFYALDNAKIGSSRYNDVVQ